MGIVKCTQAFGQGGWQIKAGEILDDSHYMVVTYPAYFSSVTNYQENVPDTSSDVYATPRVLTAAMSGSTIVNTATAGQDITLPAIAAAQVGAFYDFVTTATVSSNNWRITAATGDFLNGAVWIADFDTANTGSYFAANGSSHLVMTMNGSTKGGKAGSWLRFTAISATGWFVYGNLFGDGALATPFS